MGNFAAHSALQGACVCLLTHTDGTGALDKRSTIKVLDYHDAERKVGAYDNSHRARFPEERLASFPDLLKRLPKEWRVELSKQKLAENGYELAGDLRRLHEFRNDFTHFTTKGWSLEIVGLPRIVGRAVELVERITQSHEFRSFNKFPEMEMQPLFDDLRLRIKEVSSTPQRAEDLC